jgi:hypothetical protein
MRQFINGSETAFADLERRARDACIVFQNEEMPPGAQPPLARVGFEVAGPDLSAALLVQHGVSYDGPCESVREWLYQGERRFPSFGDLKNWIRSDLASCYSPNPTGGLNAVNSPRPHATDPNLLTDLDVIRDSLPLAAQHIVLDETALLEQLRTHVRGQDAALKTLARRVCRHLARVQPSRPASLFEVGPTGCGKTRTAESLPSALRELTSSASCYGYLRLDMSEYQERHRISQRLGAPQGYIGYGEGAQLIDALAANPRTIILFDEIEKAHKDVFQTLLNAMDAGRLSTATRTSQGRTVDCRHALFLFTSNLESIDILHELEEREAFEHPTVVDDVCRRRLRAAGLAPELLGRINAFLVFRPLTQESRAEIITQAVARVANEYGLRIRQIEPGAVLAILEQAKSDGYGARPDEYLVDDLLGPAFAEAVAGGASTPVKITGGPPFRCEPDP